MCKTTAPVRAASFVREEILEASGGQLGVAHRVGNVPVAQVVLDGAGVVAVVRQLEAGPVPQHVGVDGHIQA